MSASLETHLLQAEQEGLIRALDRHFALQLCALWPCDDESGKYLLLSAVLTSQALTEGHVCIRLDQLQQQPVLTLQNGLTYTCPALQTWLDALAASPAVAQNSADKPLVLDTEGRLYLARYWDYEQRLARLITARKQQLEQGDFIDEEITRLLGQGEPAKDQRHAVKTALNHRFSIITGGPGTGKTRTVAVILAILLQHNRQQIIKLAAPTGKAASRMQESLRDALQQFTLDQDLLDAMPDQALTLHRLLGFHEHTSLPDYHANNPLDCDCLIVDEASMIDLPMMVNLFQALPETSRLILLGDRYQLASVEAGQVLADMCGPTHTTSAQSSIAVLKHSFRFAADSPIGQLSTAVNLGDAQTSWQLLKQQKSLVDTEKFSLKQYISDYTRHYIQPLLHMSDVDAALKHAERHRLLSPLRIGPFGITALNQLIEMRLQADNPQRTDKHQGYKGRLIIIMQNDHAEGLYNGDIGLIWPDERNQGQLRAWFRQQDGNLRSLPGSVLPRHETAFAMTIHQSQGSEYQHLALVLPDSPNPILSRELIYTAITRAKTTFSLYGDPAIWHSAIEKQSTRRSGLYDQLWNE